MSRGRDQIDWECELGVVIGHEASHVPVVTAAEYVFGHTLHNDVSNRGERGDKRLGNDWLIGKSHDAFAPLGPFIVSKEFVPMRMRFALDGETLQEGNMSQMTTGDVIGTGTPASVGPARTLPIYLKDGDRSVCTYADVGTLTNPAVGPSVAPGARQ